MMWTRRKLEVGSAPANPYLSHFFGWPLCGPTQPLGGYNIGMNARNKEETILADFFLPFDV